MSASSIDVQAQLVGQVEERRVVGVVRRAHGVEPELLHQDEVGAHRLAADHASGVLVEVVAVHAADEDAPAVDEQVDAADLDAPEADPEGRLARRRRRRGERRTTDRVVEVRDLRRPRRDVRELGASARPRPSAGGSRTASSARPRRRRSSASSASRLDVAVACRSPRPGRLQRPAGRAGATAAPPQRVDPAADRRLDPPAGLGRRPPAKPTSTREVERAGREVVGQPGRRAGRRRGTSAPSRTGTPSG